MHYDCLYEIVCNCLIIFSTIIKKNTVYVLLLWLNKLTMFPFVCNLDVTHVGIHINNLKKKPGLVCIKPTILSFFFLLLSILVLHG